MNASLIIPAYNEERRLPAFLRALSDFHASHGGMLYEILVVDDGSTDRTAGTAGAFAGPLPIRVIRLPMNRGKGAAVRAGVMEALGDAVIFMDADGATAPGELPKLLNALEHSPIAVGNRWMPGSHVTEREPFRALSGWIYRTTVGLFGLSSVDTMCGFKGFRRESARTLFEKLREERWLFDTEIMLRARRRSYRIANVPITWTSKRGSKLRPAVLIRASFQIPLLAIRVRRERSPA